MPIILAYAEPPAVAAPPPRASVITSPDWLRKPTGADMAQFYPKAAADAHIEGRATLRCQVAATGELTDCTTSNEDPPGQGFGDAALKLSAYFKMRPMTKDGVPVSGARINIPIRFALPKQEPATPSAELALRCYGYAAAEAERNPASPAAQVGVIAFGFLIQARLVPERARPSEVAQVLASQRSIAAGKLDDPKFKGERDECAAAIPADSAAGLQKMISELPR